MITNLCASADFIIGLPSTLHIHRLYVLRLLFLVDDSDTLQPAFSSTCFWQRVSGHWNILSETWSNDLGSAILFLRVYALGGRGYRLKVYLIGHFVVRIATPMFSNNLELIVRRISSFISGQLRWGSYLRQKFRRIVSHSYWSPDWDACILN